MIVDMSQAAVNRTAMYHISYHVHGLINPSSNRCQFFGQVFDEIPSAAHLQQLQKKALEDLLGDPDDFVRKRSQTSIAAQRQSYQAQTIYLDPLYTLFGKLQTNDTVFVLDLSTVTTPSWHRSNVGRAYSLAFDLICSQRPTVIAISQNTADTLYANYGFPIDRTHVVPLYVPHHFLDEANTQKFFSPEPYVLFVGSLETRKNLAGAIESFRISGLGERGFRFVIAGGAGHGSEEISRAVRTTRNVFVTGYVENDQLRALYRGASAFVYPSYLEGFGIPLLEAMHFGIPAVASTTGACPEVGGKLIRYFDPDDHLSFGRELVRLVEMSMEERQAYATAAQQWVEAHFSMARFDEGLRSALGYARA